jgi:outer membrane lipoprotein SlyB
MSAELQNTPAPAASLSAVPRAVWIGGGLLAMATAGLAGALAMRSGQIASPDVLVQPAAVALSAPAMPTAPVAPAAEPVVLPAQKPAPLAAKPARSTSKPVPPTHAPAQAERGVHVGTRTAAVCASCGTVESVTPVQQKGQGTGLGAVAGGVLGGVLGHQVGGGNGKTAMTVLGAVGGGFAGNEVEKRARSETLFDVRVRMEDGSVRAFQRAQSLAVGTSVIVEGTTLRAARDSGGAPLTVQTSVPAATGT